jgi:acyl-CoA synthetase (AMP-forming)/AMP-acid ligase II
MTLSKYWQVDRQMMTDTQIRGQTHRQTGIFIILFLIGKLNTRSQKICYSLLNKLGTKNEPAVRQGGRVALIYSAHDPAGLCAGFFGCIFAGVVPVAIEPPASKDVSYFFCVIF